MIRRSMVAITEETPETTPTKVRKTLTQRTSCMVRRGCLRSHRAPAAKARAQQSSQLDISFTRMLCSVKSAGVMKNGSWTGGTTFTGVATLARVGDRKEPCDTELFSAGFTGAAAAVLGGFLATALGSLDTNWTIGRPIPPATVAGLGCLGAANGDELESNCCSDDFNTPENAAGVGTGAGAEKEDEMLAMGCITATDMKNVCPDESVAGFPNSCSVPMSLSLLMSCMFTIFSPLDRNVVLAAVCLPTRHRSTGMPTCLWPHAPHLRQ